MVPLPALDLTEEEHPAAADMEEHRAVVDMVDPVEEAVELVTFSASPSVTLAVTDTVTAGTSPCPGGSGIPAASDTTRDTDSESTVSEEVVDSEVVAEDMEEDREDMEVVDREEVIKPPLFRASISPLITSGPLANQSDNCSSHPTFCCLSRSALVVDMSFFSH